ncbi:MAG: LysR family transcriptional regulator [Bdellovibrionota bacterium]
MNLLHLEYFYEVARTGSFMESSKNLRISQPAVSKMVRQLEESLGVALLVRSRRGAKLTEEGELLFQTASRIFLDAKNAAEALNSSKRELRGPWTLGASDNIALHLVPELLGKFKEENPALRVGLFAGTSEQIKSELQYDRCQLGIFFTPVKASEPFSSRQIFETEFWVVIARKNRWLKGKKSKLMDLIKASVPRIESRHSDYSAGFPAHFHSARLGLSGDPWIQVNQHEVKKKLVLGGYGFALLTKHTVEAEVKSGELLRVECLKLPAPVFAVWRKGQEPGRASLAFLDAWEKSLGTRSK